MLMPRRYTRLSRLPRTLLFDLLPVLLVIWSVAEVLSIQRAMQAVDEAAAHAAAAYTPGEKIFISSIHLHDEQLLRTHWNAALLSLVDALGPSNVFVSIYESNSLDDTKGALRELDAALEAAGVRKSIVLDTSTRADELSGPKDGDGWITTPSGEKEKRRIPYLARLRNRALEPLDELDAKGERFDRILFLNDIVYTAADILALLTTNAGHYAAACALDFRHPPHFYDTFATRDAARLPPLTTTFPFFASAASRRALTRGAPAVPVAACWNGATAMAAAPFYTKLRRLRFRALDDDLARQHVEASECCLVHADNPYASARGVFVNPAVRVAYAADAHAAVHPPAGRAWLGAWAVWKGVWANRGARVARALPLWGTAWARAAARDGGAGAVGRRIRDWEGDFRRTEPGGFCAVDEMQVLRMDGWAHV